MENHKEQDVVSAILAQAQEGKRTIEKKSTNFSLTNYFGIHLPDGVNQATIQIRLLPNPEEGCISPFTIVYGHKIQMPNGQWQTFLCPKEHNDTDCPFCQARTELLATGDKEDKADSKKYNTKKMYVVKIIQRDKENEGVKFWRFAHSYDGQGIMDKITAIISMKRCDVSNTENGRDLYLDVRRNQKGLPVVSSILDAEPSRLSNDDSLFDEWSKDKRIWKDVYSIKPYDYLKLVVEGEEPYYDKDSKTFVSKDIYEAKKNQKSNELKSSGEISMGNGNLTQNGVKAEIPVSIIDDNIDDSSDDEYDDLPF